MGSEGRIAATVIGGIVALTGISLIIVAATMFAPTYWWGEVDTTARDAMYAIGAIILFAGGIPFLWGVAGLVGGGKKSYIETPFVKPARTLGGTNRWAESFKCGRCGMPLTAYKVKVKGPSAKVRAVCPSKHEFEFLLPMSQQAEWIDTLTAHIFRCKKCGAELLYPEKLDYSEGYAKYKLRCPTCGSSHRYVKMILHSPVDDVRQRLVAPPAKPRAKTLPRRRK